MDIVSTKFNKNSDPSKTLKNQRLHSYPKANSYRAKSAHQLKGIRFKNWRKESNKKHTARKQDDKGNICGLQKEYIALHRLSNHASRKVHKTEHPETKRNISQKQ